MNYIISNPGTFDSATALILGQAPSQFDDPLHPITGKTGRRLCELMGWVALTKSLPRWYFALFDRANLFDAYPGKATGGDRFPPLQARQNALNMALDGHFARYQEVVLLGRGVQDATQHGPTEWFQRYRLVSDGPTFMAIPHPSGRNRWWNLPSNVALAERHMRNLLVRMRRDLPAKRIVRAINGDGPRQRLAIGDAHEAG